MPIGALDPRRFTLIAVAIRTNATTMCLDNGAAYGQAHPHAALLGREEVFEQPRKMLRFYAGPAVIDLAAQCRHYGGREPSRIGTVCYAATAT